MKKNSKYKCEIYFERALKYIGGVHLFGADNLEKAFHHAARFQREMGAKLISFYIICHHPIDGVKKIDIINTYKLWYKIETIGYF